MFSFRAFIKFLNFIFSAILLSTGVGHAQRVQPLLVDLEPGGAGGRTTIIYENTTSGTVVIEPNPRVFGTPSSQNDDTAAKEDFVVFPPSAAIEPGQTQVFRVQYVGEPNLDTSQLYALGFEQLPITPDATATGAALGFAVNFDVFVAVNPRDSNFNLKVNNVSVDDISGNYKVEIENTGSRYVRAGSLTWTFSNTTGQTRELKGVALNQIMRTGDLVAPNARVEIQVASLPDMVSEGMVINIEP